MRIKYSTHLKRRIILRKISPYLPEKIFRILRFEINHAPEERHFVIYENSCKEFPYGNITESEVLYLNFDISTLHSSVEINCESPKSLRSQFEGEGSTAYDKSGTDNDGTLTNMDPGTDWVTGKYGYALDFDEDSSQLPTTKVVGV